MSRGRGTGDHIGRPRGQHLVTAMGDIPTWRAEIPVTVEAGAPLEPASAVCRAACAAPAVGRSATAATASPMR
jgi:hypothetical protein